MTQLPAWKRPLVPLARIVVRWIEWDGDCHHPVELWINDLQFHCARPVTRIGFALFGRGLHRH